MNQFTRTMMMAAVVVAGLVSAKAEACIGGPPGARCLPAPQMDPAVKNALDIMNALDIPEVDPTPGIVGATNREKKVGGLTCRKTMGFGPRGPFTKARCEFKGRRNYKAIFEALDVPAINVTPAGMVGSVTHQKRVANLVCDSSKPVVPRAKASYMCELQ